MRADFVEFWYIVRKCIKSGEIKLTDKNGNKVELSDFDLAVQYAIGQIGERKGYPNETTTEEIWAEINKFAPELLDESEEE